MDGYIAKPIQSQALFQIIEDLAICAGSEEDDHFPSAGNVDVLDKMELANRVSGDAELLANMVDLFAKSYPGLVAEMKEALLEADLERIKMVAHSLKGTVGTLGAHRAVHSALSLESAVASEETVQVDKALKGLELELEGLQKALKSFVDEMKGRESWRM